MTIYENLGGEQELHCFEELGHESYTAGRPEEWEICVARFPHHHVLVG